MTSNSSDLGLMSKQYAARDLPGQTKLKYRDLGQAAPDEIKRDKKELKKELESREKQAVSGKDSNSSKRLSIMDKEPTSAKKLKPDQTSIVNLDADEVLPDDDSDDEDLKKRSKKAELDGSDEEDDDDDEEDDEDDDTEALMAELNRIKQERAAEAARQEAERKVREEKIRVENILKGNPLLNKPATSASVEFKVKRNWDDDVVFKNCAKLDDNKPKEFINDTLRSDFHKKFMERYIK